MAKVKDYIFLHLSVMLFSFTSVFSKMASRAFNDGGLTNPWLYVFGICMFGVCFVYAFLWQKAIKKFDLNIGYANRSVYLLWSQLWAVTIFSETLTPRNIIGILVVLVGVVIVSLSAQHDEGKKEVETA